MERLCISTGKHLHLGTHSEMDQQPEKLFILYITDKINSQCLISFTSLMFLFWAQHYFWAHFTLTKLYVRTSHALSLFFNTVQCTEKCAAWPCSRSIHLKHVPSYEHILGNKKCWEILKPSLHFAVIVWLSRLKTFSAFLYILVRECSSLKPFTRDN